jgi:hypothetical protein
MKIRLDSDDIQREYIKKWHCWFAWYPIRVNSHELVWLEMVERKYDYINYAGTIRYEYKKRGTII